MTADPLIRVTGLGKAFGAALVLDSVTLDVQAGQAVALLGANGAGKTTLLKILATLVRPSRGSAAIAGHNCVQDAESVRRNIGVVAHGPYLYNDLTAVENLKFWTMLAGRPAPPDAIRTALADVELDAVADERVRTFSAGMRRRLSLARFVLLRPRVLLLDEPFASLDQRARKWLEEFLRSFKQGGGAALMATHSLGRGLDAADRIAILAGGRIAVEVPSAGLPPEEIHRLYALHTEESA